MHKVKKESNKECTEETNKNTEKKVMKTGSENFIFAEGKEWEPAGEGVVRQIMGYNDDIMVVKVKFEKGAVGAVHHHIHSQVTYVESGKFEFIINGVKKLYRPATVCIRNRMLCMVVYVWNRVC